MTNFVPIKLAVKCFLPSSGEEKNTNPVIFLHGASLSKESFHDLPQIIADGTKRKVYALDARNHGDSEHSDIYNFDMNVDDVFHFMDTINAQKAVLIGHSMGGITSINAALRKPERIEKIFVEDIYTKKIPKDVCERVVGFLDIFAAAVHSTPKELDYNEACRHICEVFYSKLPPGTKGIPSKDVFLKQQFALKRTSDGAYDFKLNFNVMRKAFMDCDTLMSEPSGLYNGPAYFFYGSLSEFKVWEEDEHIKKLFPNAELVRFEGASHGIHFEFPEEFTAAILQRMNP